MAVPTSRPAPQRLLSLDALRGFDMFWIVGGDALAKGLYLANQTQAEVAAASQPAAGAAELVHGATAAATGGWSYFFARQLEHVAWEGFVFYDLIFPLFVFLMGVSIPFAVDHRIQQNASRGELLRHALVRTAVLLFLGFIYYGGFSNTYANMRFVGVLQRIALCYLAATAVYLYCRPPQQVAWLAGLLVGYWLFMLCVPFPPLGEPNLVTGVMTPYDNLAAHVDRLLLPGYRYFTGWGNWDPEGLLSTLPAIGTALLGVLAGEYLLTGVARPARKALTLAGCGLLCALGGYAWAGFHLPAPQDLAQQVHEETLESAKGHDPVQASVPLLAAAKRQTSWRFPIIKKVWTSSYVLLAGGCSLMLLAGFYLVIDVWGYKAWCWPLAALGANSIAVYLFPSFCPLEKLAPQVFPGLNTGTWGKWDPVVSAVGQLALILLAAMYLYRRRFFIKI